MGARSLRRHARLAARGERRQGRHPVARQGERAVRGARAAQRLLPRRRGHASAAATRRSPTGRSTRTACLLFDDRQYAGPGGVELDALGRSSTCATRSTRPPELDWTPVWSLTDERHRLLPTGHAVLRGARGPGDGKCYVRADSNGNAAGASLEDAVLQGLLELVERDAVALWWYNRTRCPGSTSTRSPTRGIDELRAVYAGLHREVWVLDMTADLGIPTLVALSRRTDKPCEDIMFGFGAHLDPKVALRRALTEMNQLMPVGRVGNRGRRATAGRTPTRSRWWRHATVANQPYLAPDPTRRSPDAGRLRLPADRRPGRRRGHDPARASRHRAWRCSCSTRPGRTSGCRWSR